MKTLVRILKVIGKTIGIILGSVLAFVALCCIVTLAWGAVQVSRGTVTELPETPADFSPEIRFVVFSDSHNKNENVADCIDTAYSLYDKAEGYNGVDAFFVLGDFSSIGNENDYDNFIATVDEHARKETRFITILGNHEMKRRDARDIFRSKFGYEPDGVYEINGFRFIAFSGERGLTEWTFTPSSLKWAKNALAEAEAASGDRPVFEMQHPHNFGTVYGSSVWGDFQTNPLWAGHSKVVSFSGHSHFPMNDPRSINQGTYTSVGVGGTSRFELDKNYVVGQHPDGVDTANEMCIVEADSKGSVRIQGYDCNSDTFFCDWFIENVNDLSSYAYTRKNLKAHDRAPEMAEDTKTTLTRNEKGEWVLSFDEAEAAEGFIVHDYHVTIKDKSGRKVYKDTFIDDYFVIDDDDTADFRIPADKLTEGETYQVHIVAESAYHYKSAEFVAEVKAG